MKRPLSVPPRPNFSALPRATIARYVPDTAAVAAAAATTTTVSSAGAVSSAVAVNSAVTVSSAGAVATVRTGALWEAWAESSVLTVALDVPPEWVWAPRYAANNGGADV